jgi:hypothetical protein
LTLTNFGAETISDTYRIDAQVGLNTEMVTLFINTNTENKLCVISDIAQEPQAILDKFVD